MIFRCGKIVVNKSDHLRWSKHAILKNSDRYKDAMDTGFKRLNRDDIETFRRFVTSNGTPEAEAPALAEGSETTEESTEAPRRHRTYEGCFKYMTPDDVCFTKWQRLIPAGFAPCK